MSVGTGVLFLVAGCCIGNVCSLRTLVPSKRTNVRYLIMKCIFHNHAIYETYISQLYFLTIFDHRTLVPMRFMVFMVHLFPLYQWWYNAYYTIILACQGGALYIMTISNFYHFSQKLFPTSNELNFPLPTIITCPSPFFHRKYHRTHTTTYPIPLIFSLIHYFLILFLSTLYLCFFPFLSPTFPHLTDFIFISYPI